MPRNYQLSTFQQLEHLKVFKFQVKMKLTMVRCVDKDKVILNWKTVKLNSYLPCFVDTGRRGKMLASCVIVFLVALLSFLIFSLLDITRTEPKVSVAENGQDYGYFKIKQWP